MGRNSEHLGRTTESAHPIQVLVVDDHPLLRKGLQNLFNACGDFKVIGEAADGEKACELAQLLQPDVVLMDIELPKMNGIEATRWIKATLPHVIIIGLSIHQSSTVANLMKAAGATAVLTKDTAPENIYRVIRSALEQRGGRSKSDDPSGSLLTKADSRFAGRVSSHVATSASLFAIQSLKDFRISQLLQSILYSFIGTRPR